MHWRLIGIAAASLTAFSFIPQIVKVIRNKSAHDVSVVMLFQFSLGVLLWMAYGIYLDDLIIILANGVTLTSLLFLLVLYYFYGRRKK